VPAVTLTSSRWLRAGALGLVVAAAGYLAVQLHRTGHTQGDDFALYLRQARSIFEGDIGAVIADNRFSVLNSDASFSPVVYPWVWPLLLSPFVRLWGYDYDRLKLIEVALLMVWLVLLHGIVRRRIGRLPALAVIAVLGTAPLYLAHTDQLLTEIPHLVTVTGFVWWYDRIRSRATLLTAGRFDLVVLGLSAVLALNVRREGFALLVAVAAVQIYDLATADDRPPGWQGRREGVLAGVRTRWRALITPYLAFTVGAIVFQLLVPGELLPDNGNSRSFIDDRLGEYPEILADQLGLGAHPLVGIAVLGFAAAGAVIGVRRRPTLDLPLLALGIGSTLMISTHLRRVDRYWFQITPWVLYFATVALVSLALVLFARRRRIAQFAAVVPLAAIVVAHLVVLPGKISDVQDFNAAGRVQWGPANPQVTPVFEAVSEFTRPDAVIAYFRARTMTLLTDRRSFQTRDLERIAQDADYFAQRRDSTYWQPDLAVEQARLAGFEEVWSDARWILWKTPAGAGGPDERVPDE
jgi:hypothetical protein